MKVAKVIGSVWCAKQHEALNGSKLLLIQPMDGYNGKAFGEPLMALDNGMNSGPGDVVLVMDEGGSARAILKNKKAPVRTIICGVVDSVTVGGKTVKYH